MRRAARTDTNHSAVVDTLRAVGAFVLDVHSVPGCLDLLTAYRGSWTLLEVKDGARPPSERRPTDAEKETIRHALGQRAPSWIVYNEDEALIMIGAIDDPQNKRADIVERTHEEVSR